METPYPRWRVLELLVLGWLAIYRHPD